MLNNAQTDKHRLGLHLFMFVPFWWYDEYDAGDINPHVKNIRTMEPCKTIL